MNSILQKTTEQEPTMSSREIAELTGKPHRNVLADIRNMLKKLEVDSAKFSAQYKDSTGRSLPCFHLNRYYTEVLVTGYDVKRRAAVIKRWYDLETGAAQPQMKDPQLAAMVKMLTDLDNVKHEQAEQQKQIADLGAKIEKTPMEYYTVAGFASLRNEKINVNKAGMLGRKCAKLSREYGYDINKTHSEIFGTVNTYHVDILTEVFSQE